MLALTMARNPVKYEYDPRTGQYERVSPPAPPVGRISFQRVPLDRMGYTRRGQYFGTGAPLYVWYDEESQEEYYTRADSRDQAKKHFENVRKHLVEYGGHGYWGQKNPIFDDTSNLVIAGLGVALLGAIGIAIYQTKQANAAQTLSTAYQTQAQQSLTQSLQTNPFGQ
jgi:hypothetical protein